MSPAEQMISVVPMTPCKPYDGPPDAIYATHEGVLEFEGIRLRVYQLSDGRRVIDAGDVQRLFSDTTD